MALRVLVADDAILFRKVISDVLSSLPNVEVVGTAANGKFAVNKVRDLKPDLLTLDLEMPEMDGLATLDALKQQGLNVEVIVVSSVTRVGGDLTMRALEKGAFDFITKPALSTPEKNKEMLLLELTPRVRAVAHRIEIRTILKGRSAQNQAPAVSAAAKPAEIAPASTPGSSFDNIAGRMGRIVNPSKPDFILIGVSTGGPNALAQLLPMIPGNIGLPILIVQHMPPIFTQSLAENLASKCTLKIHEAVHGERIEPNTVYIAPGGKQMRMISGISSMPQIDITDDPPENNCKPAVDYLFRSAANNFPGRSMAVILTGMGNDGTVGLKLLKRHGCFSIAQDESSCVVYGMPKSVVDAGVADCVLPLNQIAGKIVSCTRGV